MEDSSICFKLRQVHCEGPGDIEAQLLQDFLAMRCVYYIVQLGLMASEG